MFRLLSAISDGLDWSYGVKLILIVAAAVLLCVVAVLLVAEIVGKRKRRVIHGDAQPQVIEKIVEVPVEVCEPEPEPEPVVEQVVEEVAAAQPVEEYKLDEEIQLEENAVLVDDGEDEGHILVGATQFKVRYDRSFTAKLIQSDDILKGRYNELKNELLRYTLKPRISWACESFYKGRTTYAKFAIRGKTLSLYLMLEPSEFTDTKYIFEDASAVAKYAKTPMRLKLKSDRSVRWAKELIALLAEKYGFEGIERQQENFAPEYEETMPLVNRKLIKLYYAGEQIVTQPQPQETVEVAEQVEIAAEEVVQPVIEQPQPVAEHKIDEEIELVEEAVLMDDGEDRGVVVLGDNTFEVRYNRSFTAKLIQSDDILKARYSELKNELMRYTLKPRMSWPNESLYKGRTTYAKFAIRGKTLSLYLSLDPSEYVDTKYKFEDSAEVAKYAKTPMRLKLRSDRSVRWAKELIAQLAEKYSLEKIEKQEENFCPEYEETTPLVNRKLIKLYYAGERVYSVPQTQTVTEVVEEQPVEEIVPEVVEEIAIAQPEPEPVEQSVEETCEQPEPEQPQPAETPYRHRKKNKPRGSSCKIISTGKLNASFEDGEEITLEKLIKKHIFPRYITYYKVLFGGEVTKAFTVFANEFSSEAKEVIENAGGTIVKI